MDSITLQAHEDCTAEGLIYDLGSLYAYLLRVVDPRKAKGIRYPLATLLLLILLAKFGGEDTPTGIGAWLKYRQSALVEMLKLPRQQVPHHCTIRRLLQQLDPEPFEQIMGEFQRSRLQTGMEVVISIDGKTLRGTIEPGQGRGVHLLAAFHPQSGLVLMEVAIESKENEIVAAPQLLQQIDLSGAIVIGDALHTQRKTSSAIVAAGGDFIWTVKGNQARTQWAIQKEFVQEVVHLQQEQPLSKHIQHAVSPLSKAHGRMERRSILVSQTLNDYLDWPHVAQVFRIDREVWHDQGRRKTRQTVYGLTSLTPEEASPQRLLELLRGYWGIENGLHYRRDVTFHEDATRTRVGHTGHNLAILNNLVIALSLSHGHKNLAEARRRFCALPQQALELVIRR